MKIAAVALSLAVSLSTLAGCAVDAPVASTQEALSAESLVGEYQFELGAERRAALVAGLEARLSGDALRAAIAELDEEAEASRLVFTRDGSFVSLIGERELVREPFTIRRDEGGAHLVGVKGREVRVELVDGELLRIHDPDKGVLEFRRIDAR